MVPAEVRHVVAKFGPRRDVWRRRSAYCPSRDRSPPGPTIPEWQGGFHCPREKARLGTTLGRYNGYHVWYRTFETESLARLSSAHRVAGDSVPLFATDNGKVVTMGYGRDSRLVLKRSPVMDALMGRLGSELIEEYG